MTLVAEKYFYNEAFRNAWIDRAAKTVVVVYDIADRANPKIERYSQIDGSVREARMINGQLTLLTSTNFNFPYERFLPKVRGEKFELDLSKLSADFSTQNVLPKRIDFVAKKSSADIGVTLTVARQLRRVNEVDATSCANINYVLPDAATLANYNFTPSFTAITRMDTRNVTQKATTSLLFGDVNKAYLTATNKLYITSSLYTNGNSACPPGAMCMLRWIEPGTQTIIHQFDTTPVKTKYLRTALVGGSLISDYAIDEDTSGNLRIVTQKTGSERESMLTILNGTFGKVGQLAGL